MYLSFMILHTLELVLCIGYKQSVVTVFLPFVTALCGFSQSATCDAFMHGGKIKIINIRTVLWGFLI